jgi:hypothetical protein
MFIIKDGSRTNCLWAAKLTTPDLRTATAVLSTERAGSVKADEDSISGGLVGFYKEPKIAEEPDTTTMAIIYKPDFFQDNSAERESQAWGDSLQEVAITNDEVERTADIIIDALLYANTVTDWHDDHPWVGPPTRAALRTVLPSLQHHMYHVRVHRDALCKSVELRKLSRLTKYRCTKRGVPSLTYHQIHELRIPYSRLHSMVKCLPYSNLKIRVLKCRISSTILTKLRRSRDAW